MTHIPGCRFWNPECPRCREIKVGDLDTTHFIELMGVSRQSFENFCKDIQEAKRTDFAELWSDGGIMQYVDVPVGLYNFWYAIMNAEALPIYYRKKNMEQHRAGFALSAE